jgi:hypothetical protein
MNMERARTALLAPAFLVLALGLPALYSTAVYYPFSSPKLAVLGLAAALAGVALAFPASAPSRTTVGPIVPLLAAGAALATLSLLFSPILGVSFWGRHDQEMGYLAMLACLTAYAMGTAFLPVLLRWPRILDLALLPAGILAALCLWATFGMPIPTYFREAEGAGLGLTFGDSALLGGYLSAMFAYALLMGLASGGRRRPLMLALSVLLAAGAVLSGSLAALLALVAGMVWVAWDSLHGRGRTRYAVSAGILVTASAAIAVAAMLRLSPLANALDHDAGVSAQTYWIALKTIAGHPLLGVGPAGFQASLLEHLTPDLVHATYFAGVVGDAHSWPLELAATYGLPFALIVAWLLLAPLFRPAGRAAAQRPAAAATIGLVVACLFGPLALSTFPLLAFFAGVTAARCPAESRAPEARTHQFLRRYVSPSLLVPVATLFLVASMHFLRTDYEVQQGNLYEETQRITEAADALIPHLPDPYRVAGGLAAFEGRFGTAQEQAAEVDPLFAKAEALDPREPMTQLDWAVALQVQDRHDDAIVRYQEALRLYPEWPLALKGIAFSYLELGRADQAIPILTRLNGLYPDDPVVVDLLARAKLAP